MHPLVTSLDVEGMMREALAEATLASSQLAHAELLALLAGGEKSWTRFEEGVLFTTVVSGPS